MALDCDGCGNEKAASLFISYGKEGRICICDRCGHTGIASSPDVYWPGHTYESQNITDRMGKPIPLTSKRQKAKIMKEMGLKEVGDRVHGSRDGSYKKDCKISDRWRAKYG